MQQKNMIGGPCGSTLRITQRKVIKIQLVVAPEHAYVNRVIDRGSQAKGSQS